MQQYKNIGITQVTPAIGAMITDVDIARRLDDDTIAEIHHALTAHSVVFFRDQQITPQDQVAFAKRFGPLRMARRAAFEVLTDTPEMQVLVNDREKPPNVNHYHTDGIFRQSAEFASMLFGVEVPETGGDTIFASLAAAYDGLSDSMKSYLEPLGAINEFMKLHGSPAKLRSWKGDNYERMDAMRRDNPPVVHPLVKTHPVTGRKHLYLSESFTTNIVGVDAEESQRLLDFLFRHVSKPEFQCRFTWQENSIAFWDNRAALHYAVADYWPEKRLMNRVTIVEDSLGKAAWGNRTEQSAIPR